MPYPKSKTRALLTIAAGASSVLLACTSNSAIGDVAPAPDAGEDANGAPVDASPDTGPDATVEGCDACGIVAIPPDSGPDAGDAGDAGDADEPSTDAAADAQEQ
jgi:hypothetical protein